MKLNVVFVSRFLGSRLNRVKYLGEIQSTHDPHRLAIVLDLHGTGDNCLAVLNNYLNKVNGNVSE